MNEWTVLPSKNMGPRTVSLKLRKGIKRHKDHASHVEVEATCEDVTITRCLTIAPNCHCQPEHLDRDLQTFIQKVAEEAAGHGHTESLLDAHLAALHRK